MKALSILILVLGGLFMGCEEAKPKEKEATILYVDYAFCSFCGGWFIRADSTLYRADVPAAFARENNNVWLRFEPDQRPGYNGSNWIVIKSIRKR
jgi:hypothetical protein